MYLNIYRITGSFSKERKLLSRVQRPYKMTTFDKQSLCQKYFFCMPLHAHAQCISYIVCAKYQD